jgi:hypothetical protein
MKTENPTQVTFAVRLPILHGYTRILRLVSQAGAAFSTLPKMRSLTSSAATMCSSCHSLEWSGLRKEGTVYCWTTVYQALDPAFADAVPYAAVVVGWRTASHNLGHGNLPPTSYASVCQLNSGSMTSATVTLPKFKHRSLPSIVSRKFLSG